MGYVPRGVSSGLPSRIWDIGDHPGTRKSPGKPRSLPRLPPPRLLQYPHRLPPGAEPIVPVVERRVRAGLWPYPCRRKGHQPQTPVPAR